MHLVSGYCLALDRLESTGANMQRDFLATNAMGVDIGQNLRREMQAGSWSGYRSLDLGVDRLISAQVAFLRLSMQIGWDGQDSGCVKQLGKCYPVVVPSELNQVRVAF